MSLVVLTFHFVNSYKESGLQLAMRISLCGFMRMSVSDFRICAHIFQMISLRFHADMRNPHSVFRTL